MLHMLSFSAPLFLHSEYWFFHSTWLYLDYKAWWNFLVIKKYHQVKSNRNSYFMSLKYFLDKAGY